MMNTNQPEGYTVPENYFAHNKEEILKLTKNLKNNSANSQNQNVHFKRRWLIPIAGIAASLLLIFGLTFNTDQVNGSLDDLDTITLLSYLENNIDSYSLEEFNDLNALLNSDQVEVDDSEYLEYLNQLDIEDIYDLM